MWEVEGGREWGRVYRRKGCLQSVGEVGETEREKIGGGGGEKGKGGCGCSCVAEGKVGET